MMGAKGAAMHDDSDPDDSPEQAAWRELAASLRRELASRVPDMGAMKPEELTAFVGACESARWLALRSALFDKEVADALARCAFDDREH
jgi:hypothetical protein